VLLAAVGGMASLYHPSVKSAQIDIPLSMPRIREVEITGAEWAVKRRLEIWDHVQFRNEHIMRHEGRVTVCGETHTEANPAYVRFISTGGGVTLESDQGTDFEQLWQNACGNMM
jgi:hypothetical protein